MTKRKQVVDPNQVINLEDPMTQDESRLKLEARVNRPKHHHALPIDSKYFRSREEEARVADQLKQRWEFFRHSLKYLPASREKETSIRVITTEIERLRKRLKSLAPTTYTTSIIHQNKMIWQPLIEATASQILIEAEEANIAQLKKIPQQLDQINWENYYPSNPAYLGQCAVSVQTHELICFLKKMLIRKYGIILGNSL
jgi:hypothetical protein